MNIEGRKIGLVAGWGRFPIVVVEALKRQGYQVYCVGVKDHADPVLRDICDGFQWIGAAKLGGMLRYFRHHGVTHATMAGKVEKTRFIGRFDWFKHMPDWLGFRTFFRIFIIATKDRKDDTILGAIVDVAARSGVIFLPATDLVPELLVKLGHIGGHRISKVNQRDIAFGWKIAKELGRLDIGQTVAVNCQAVVALEAIEGTDECIRRAGQLCRAGGFTVVKVAKPQQDMRYDVPTIGMGTLRTMAEAGARVLAVEANKTILIDEAEVIAFANQHKISVISVTEDSQSELLSDAA